MDKRKIVIELKNIFKHYNLYDKPLDRLKETIHPFRKKFHKQFHALYDINLDIYQGETLGLIGKNGSGKSTLLKLITGVLTPTTGSVHIHGKIAALLELGAGFNPEFTGIENIYLNGTVMGYKKEEIDKKLEEILAFADIGEFVNQPVKMYSSGMFVRLAFAVAINVEPDILIVDEVLSVGDIAFRNKCMARIKELRDRGTSILFVSHDLSTLQMICDRAVWLNKGRIVDIGDPVSLCQDYSAFMLTDEMQPDINVPVIEPRAKLEIIPQQDTGMAQFIEFRLQDNLENKCVYQVGQEIPIRFSLLALQPLEPVIFGLSIYRADGDWLVSQVSSYNNIVWPGVTSGEIIKGIFVLEQTCLCPGDYRVALAAYPEDLSLCYALTEIVVEFSVRANFPTWAKFLHPCKWIKM